MKTCHMSKFLQRIVLSILVLSGMIFCGNWVHADSAETSVEILPRVEEPSIPQNTRTSGSGISAKTRDITPPEIIDVIVTPLLEQSAVHILWETNEVTRSIFEYGMTENFELGSVNEKTLSLSHELIVPQVTVDQMYFYRITVFDNVGNTARTLQFFILRGEQTILRIPENSIQPFFTNKGVEEKNTTSSEVASVEDPSPYVEVGLIDRDSPKVLKSLLPTAINTNTISNEPITVVTRVERVQSSSTLEEPPQSDVKMFSASKNKGIDSLQNFRIWSYYFLLPIQIFLTVFQNFTMPFDILFLMSL